MTIRRVRRSDCGHLVCLSAVRPQWVAGLFLVQADSVPADEPRPRMAGAGGTAASFHKCPSAERMFGTACIHHLTHRVLISWQDRQSTANCLNREKGWSPF